ncbi:MAG: tetratricopeptide repeat protein [Ktedonobacteraceae bacterium]
MKKTARTRLIEERKHRQWSQQKVADLLGTTQHNVSRWEGGITTPSPYFRTKLAELFGKPPQVLGLLVEQAVEEPLYDGGSISDVPNRPLLAADHRFPLWQVPYQRNPFFTGCQDILEVLHTHLYAPRTATLARSYALHGLGGIGKTQLVVEYVYQHALEYDAIFWIVAESTKSISTSFLHIAKYLDLPEQQETDQQRLVAAMQRWLTSHSHWLLIWDNVEDLELLQHFLPLAPHGTILLTTRRQALGTMAHALELSPMAPEEGTLLLLRRAKLLPVFASEKQLNQLAVTMPTEYAAAQELALIMGGLPLALDQAGAYIEETGCSILDYLQRYQHQQPRLLNRRGISAGAHPHSVTATFRFLSQRIEQDHPATADLLRLCSLLHPDAIPEEIFTKGAIHLGPLLAATGEDPLWLNEALAALGTYALLQRQPAEKMHSIHRLVQVVLQDMLEEAEKRIWAERVMLAVNAAFPHVEHDTWPQCERLLSQALLAAHYIERYQVISEDAGRLLHETACYLYERGRYSEAEPLFQQAIRIREQYLRSEHPQVIDSLNSLANLYREQSKYAEADPLYQRALHMCEHTLGSEHPETAEIMDGLARSREAQGNSEEARAWYAHALAIRVQALGAHHPKTLETHKRLIALLHTLGQHEKAAQLEVTQS